MTNIMTADNPLVANLLKELEAATEQIASLDETLDADGASKTKVLNQAAAGVEEDGAKLTSQVASLINENNGADRIGLIVTLRKFLKNYEDEVAKYVTENVVKVEKPSEDELNRMREDRKKIVTMAQAMFDLVKNVAPEVAANYTRPSQLRGPIGSRGQLGSRLVGKFDFTVDNELVGQKFSDVQKAVGANSVAEVRQAIEAANPGFDYKAPPARFKFSVNEKNVLAESATDSDTGDDDDSDDGENGSNADLFNDDI